MSFYQKETVNPDRQKPQTTPAQPSTDPQEDGKEQITRREMPDIEHQHETEMPETPKREGNQPKQ
jgi:hypothetical protein